MIIVKGRTIQMSHRDTFVMYFAVKGYTLAENDRATLCIKERIGERTIIETEATVDVYNNILVFMDLEGRFQFLGIGEYVYDIRLDTATGERITLTYPSRFVVREVVHDA